MAFITSKDARALGIEVPRKGNKYHARKTEYKGVMYDSKAEAERAAELDAMKLAGEISWWLRQVPITLAGIKYRADFLVANLDWDNQQVHAEDVKGMEGERFRVIRKLWRQHGPFPLHILKRKNNGWNREVIDPNTKGGA